MGKPNDCAVVEWNRPNGQHEVEAIAIRKLVVQEKASVGVAVEMQYNGEIWKGQILSLHENMKVANNALKRELNSSVNEVSSPSTQPSPSPSTGKKSRKRTKNKRLAEYETLHDGDNDSPSKKQKPSGGERKSEGAKNNDKENTSNAKKKAKESAAEKERKRIERDRANQQKEKERRALTERNNLLLEQMTALVGGKGSENSFTSDVVRECVDLTTPLTPPPPNPTRQLEKTITELQSITPCQELTIAQLQKTLATLQGNSEEPVPTTGELYQPLSLSAFTSTPQLQRTPLADTPRINSSVPRQVSRPTVGGKCPRRNLPLQPSASSDDEEEVCASCTRLKQRVRELEDQLKSSQGQVSDPPRPGRISPILAERFKMVELTPGSQVFIYQNLIHQAIGKPSYKAAASFLLNCFYTNDELMGMNLSGANERPHPDKYILDSIIGFVLKENAKSCPSPSAIKIALRNKLSALESRKAKK